MRYSWWLASLAVLVPFVIASATVLNASRRRPPEQARERSLAAVAILVAGIVTAVAVLHAGRRHACSDP